MNRKKVINCLIVLMVNGVVLTGCSSTKSELKKLLRSGSQIELTLGGTAEYCKTYGLGSSCIFNRPGSI